MISDKEILEWYWKGWNDRLDGMRIMIPKEIILQRAHLHGWMDAILGDDCKSIDLQSDEEILKYIKRK